MRIASPIMIAVCLLISVGQGEFITNGNFETGDLTGWTPVGSAFNHKVVTSMTYSPYTITPYEGTYLDKTAIAFNTNSITQDFGQNQQGTLVGYFNQTTTEYVTGFQVADSAGNNVWALIGYTSEYHGTEVVALMRGSWDDVVGSSYHPVLGQWHQCKWVVDDDGLDFYWDGNLIMQDWPNMMGISEITIGGGWGTTNGGYDGFSFTSSIAPDSCEEAIELGYGYEGDINGDCYVNIIDWKQFSDSWMQCIDPNEANCERPWLGGEVMSAGEEIPTETSSTEGSSPDDLIEGFEDGDSDGWILYNNDPYSQWDPPYVGVALEGAGIMPHSGAYMAIMPYRDYYSYTATKTLANPEYGTMTGHLNLVPDVNGELGPGISAIRIYDNFNNYFIIYTNVYGNGKVSYITTGTGTVTTTINATPEVWHEIKFVTDQNGTAGYWDGQLLYHNATISHPVCKVIFGSSWGSAAAAYDDFSFPTFQVPTPYVNNSPPPIMQVDSEPFFPLGFYDHYMYSTPEPFLTRYATHKSQGMNTTMLWGANWAVPHAYTIYALDAAQANDMKMFVQIHHYAMVGDDPAYPLTLIDEQVDALWDHSALIGWYLFEEPINRGIFPNLLQSRYARVRSHDPASHPMAIQHHWPPERYLAVEPPAAFDISITAVDPCPEVAPEFGGPMWISATETRSAVLLANAHNKPVVINHVQATALQEPPNHYFRYPTFAELRYLSYAPIVEGARGLLYWDWGQGGEYDLQRIEYSENVVGPIANEIKTLIPAILANSTSVSVTSDHDSDTTGHSIEDITYLFVEDTNYAYLIAVNNTAIAIPSVAFVLTGVPLGSANGAEPIYIEVIFENRFVSLQPISGYNWTMTDNFSPYGVNVYRLCEATLPVDCTEVSTLGYKQAGDISGDCYVNLLDLTNIIQDWLKCVKPDDPLCDKPWVNLILSSCTDPDAVSGDNRKIFPFAGQWAGSGIDSEGNEFTFAAKVISLGGHKYRILILDKHDTQKEPMHIMDGVLNDNKFVYIADEGTYVGEGQLDNEFFKGYYKGPVDGTYQMHRVKWSLE
jgi:hypothetical protein